MRGNTDADNYESCVSKICVIVFKTYSVELKIINKSIWKKKKDYIILEWLVLYERLKSSNIWEIENHEMYNYSEWG